MAVMTTVQQILADHNLVPWIEERAFRFSMHRFVMAQRVQVFTDMSGWNTRKVSNYIRPKGANKLSEGVEIPTNKIDRRRLAEISPEEWGDRFPITNRRTSTDPEAVLADTVSFLGYSMGRKREQLLFQAALAAAGQSGLKIAASGAYTLEMAVQMQTHYESKAWDGQLFHVIHPFQEVDVKLELLKLTNPAVPEFRNQFIRQWHYGGFGGLNLAVSSMVPRKVVKRLVMTGAVAGDKFRLRFGLEDTADITVGATVADTVTAIKNALEALPQSVADSLTFTVAGTAYNDIKVTSPIYTDEEMQLELGLDAAGNVLDEIGITVQEVSALARAPFLQPEAVVYDIRDRLTVYQEWKPAFRTLDIGGYEVYGIGPWNAERAAYIETDATSPLAVP